MKIEIDTSNLSPLDHKVLAVLAEGAWPSVEAVVAADGTLAEAQAAARAEGGKLEVTVEEPKKPINGTPVKKPAPAEPEPAPAEDAPTMADAVAAATQLVSSGEAAKVKAALATVGSKRVSEVAPENIGAFLAALA